MELIAIGGDARGRNAWAVTLDVVDETWVIETRKARRDEDGNSLGLSDWSTDPIGPNNSFDSEEEALDAVDHLRELGHDWAEGEYRVRETASGETVEYDEVQS